jgi:tetratricopeptide (TPR) repeat protein
MMYSVPVSRFTSQVMREERDFISQYLDFPWDILQEISQLPGKFQQGKYEEGRSIIKNLLPQVKNSKLLENLEYSLIVSDVYCDEDFETGLSRLQDYADKYPKGLRANDVQNQIAFFSEVLQIKDRIVEDPEDFSSHQQLGYLFLQRRIDVLAEKEFMLALKDTTLDDTYLGLGYVYLRTNRPEEAVIYLEIYLSRHPEDGDTFNRIGYAYLQTNRMENALRCFLKYVELEPTNPNSHDSYAECLMNMGRNEEAIAEYKKALELNPNWSNGFYMLGEIYRGMGNKEEAVVYYQRYLDMDPGGVQSQNAKTQIETLTKDQ